MKKLYFLFALAFASCTVEQDLSNNDTNNAVAVDQSGKCELCAASEFATTTEPNALFDFSNGKRLMVCGTYEPENGKKVFSEFVLSECGDKNIVDYWDATEKYAVEYAQDTLKLHKLELLALGANRELVHEVWQTEYFYYKGDKLKREVMPIKTLKYSQSQIDQTLREYESSDWLTMANSDNGENAREVLANRLLISAISGNEKAEDYFKEIDSKLKVEGEYASWYNQLVELQKAAKKGR